MVVDVVNAEGMELGGTLDVAKLEESDLCVGLCNNLATGSR